MAEVVITGVRRLSQVGLTAHQTAHSQLPAAKQPDHVSQPQQGVPSFSFTHTQHRSEACVPTPSVPSPIPKQFQTASQQTQSPDQLDNTSTTGSSYIQFRLAPITGQAQPPHVPAGPLLAHSQLRMTIGSAPTMVPFLQAVEPSSTVSSVMNRIIHHPVRQFLHPQADPVLRIVSTSQVSPVSPQPPLQQQQQRGTPSPSSRGQGYPSFSQPQFPPRPGGLAMVGQSPRLSPIDTMVHSSTPQFPQPHGQHHSPGRGAAGEKKDYICLECGKVFKSQQALGYHRNAKHGVREDLKCPICGKMLSHKQHKTYHMKNVHGLDASLL